MNMVCASTYLYLLELLSSVSYNFPSTGLLYPGLNLFPGILFLVAIINWIVFLVSLSDSSLLVYKNATDFWIFILYPATLLNSFICSSSFFGGIFRVLYIQYHAIQQRETVSGEKGN